MAPGCEPTACTSSTTGDKVPPIEIPDHLTHYYRDEPFRSLTDLDADRAAAVVRSLADDHELPFRLTQPHYLPRRREIESEMRALFIRKGGAPRSERPSYLILGPSKVWAQLEPRAVRVVLDDVPDDVLSFTFTDSFFCFCSENLRGIPIPPQPFHNQVFRRGELTELVAEFGLPGIAPGPTLHAIFDPYIEVQLWCSPTEIPVAHAAID